MTNKTWFQELLSRLAEWLAYRLPHDVVYYAVIRAGVNATTGEWSNVETPGVTISDILSRWHKQGRLSAEERVTLQPPTDGFPKEKRY